MQNTKDEHPSINFFESLCQHCEGGFINLRFIHKDEDPKKTVSKFIPLSDIKSIPKILRNYTKEFNCYFGVCSRVNGDGSKNGIIQIPALWCDLDTYKLTDEQKRESRQRYKDFPLKATFIINSGGGRYLLWMFKEPGSKEDIPKVENLLKRLASYFYGDMNATDASRILRIPGSLNHKYQHTPQVGVIETHLEKKYSLENLEAVLPEIEKPSHQTGEDQSRYNQERTERLNQIMECEFLKHCDCDRATLSEPEWYSMISILARETGGPNFIHSLSRGYPKYFPLETDKKILHALNEAGPATCERIKTMWDCGKDCEVRSPAVLALREKQNETIIPLSVSSHKDQPSWPSPLAKQAFYGLAGEFVKLIEPHTEADPVAILIQIITAIGYVIGATAHFKVEADTHYLKIFPVLVGETSKGRKGTSWGYIKDILKRIDPECRIMSGLSSGEGLIWQVRDEIIKKESIKDKGRTIDYQDVVADAGESDKRLIVIEQEFASTLRVIGRDGNILSPVIRQAWDDGNLQTLTKNSPARATGAHISIICHITRNELRRYLDRTETGNGFANRFIWLCIKRSKALPDGGQFYKQDFEPLLEKFKEVVEFGKTIGEMSKDSEAQQIWNEVYPTLSEGKPGLFGEVISRGEAQVMRIACIYAILDKSKMIRKEHLWASLAIWDYSEKSVRYIFGDATGDWIADRILQALRRSTSGLTRTEISNLFSRNLSGEKFDLALSFLEKLNLISMVKEDSGGRPVERWVTV
jgi:hypothetical protein